MVFEINGSESTSVDAADEDIFFLWKAVFDISQTEEMNEQSQPKADPPLAEKGKAA